MVGVLLFLVQLSAARHWAPGARVAVWVDPNHAPPGAAMLVGRAMKNWTDASRGQLTLVAAKTRDEAAIRVFFVSSDNVYGEAAPRVDPQTGFIGQADVAINSAVPADSLDAAIILYLTALHELGHALGLPHSDTFSAIMYRFRRPDDGARYFGAFKKKVRSLDDVGSARASGLDAEDTAALQALYSSQFSVLSSKFSVLSSKFSVISARRDARRAQRGADRMSQLARHGPADLWTARQLEVARKLN